MNRKFCKKEVDSIYHVLFNCEPIKEIWSALEKIVIANNSLNVKLNRDMILYNFFENVQSKNIESILGIFAAKAEIIRRKEILGVKNQNNWNNKTFRKQVLWVIKTKIQDHQKSAANNTINGISDQKKILLLLSHFTA